MKSSMIILPEARRIAWLGAILLLGVVFLVGCGGSDEPAADSTTPPDATSEDAGAADETSTPTPETSGGDESDAMPEEVVDPEPMPEGEEPDAAAASTPPAAPEPAPEAAPAPATVAAPEEQLNPRPNDVLAWQDEDFLAAKQDRDPKLLDAVAYLGENYSGDPEAAKLLVTLLTTPEDPEPEPKPEPKVEKKPAKKPGSEYDQYGPEMGAEGYEGQMGEGYEGMMDEGAGYEGEMGEGAGMYGDEGMYSGEGGQKKVATKAPLAASYVSLTGGIVRALGANGTQEARTVLEQLLAGKLVAGNDRTAVGAVLRTLVDYPSAENDELLRKALTAPEGYRPSSEKMASILKQAMAQAAPEVKEGEKAPDVDAMVAASLADKVTAEDIRDTILPLVVKSASMTLRYDLAVYLIGKPSEEIRAQLRELVMATHPLNIAAQIGLYRYTGTPPETQNSFERYFTSYASSSLGRILAVSTDEVAAVDVPITTQQGGAGQGANQIWSPFGNEPSQPKPSQGGSTPYGPEGSGAPEGASEMYEGMEGEPGATTPSDPYGEGGMGEGGPGATPNTQYGEEGMYGEGGMEGGAGPAEGSNAKPPKGPGGADKMSIQKFEEVAAGDPNLPYELAQHLWGQQLGATMAVKMNALNSLEEGAQLLMLAGHIPTDAMRAQLLKTLQAHWEDGPEAFASAAVFSKTGISDPGFIPVIKSLPRREPPAKQAKTAPTKEMNAQYAWMQTVYGTVRGFCEQMQTAADNQMVNQAEVIESLPFKVRSPDTLTHVYAMDWQKHVGGRLVGAPVDPMKVYYLRFEETALYSKVHGTYKRAVPSGSERLVKNGLWIDGNKSGPEAGRRTSMDVIIDRPEFKAERKPSEPERMVIQVLYVEINDPNPPKAAGEG